MEKIKVAELVKGLGVQDIIKEVRENFESNLTEHQWGRIEKKVEKKAVEMFVENMKTELKKGNSIEVPHTLHIRVTESSMHKNEKNEPKKKLSIRTREAFKRDIN